MARNRIIPYDRTLRRYARDLRNHSTLSEVLLWQRIKKKALGWEFHRQVPMHRYIVDFFCHELMLAIEIDGSSHDDKKEYDENRQRRLQGLGVRFIRFGDAEVKMNMDGVLAALRRRIAEIVGERGATSP